MSEANSLRCAFDQAGNIGKHEAKFIPAAGLTHSYHTKIR